MKPHLWLILSIAVAAVTWLYVHRALLPWEHAYNVHSGALAREMGDLFSPWTGAKELFLFDRNPYSTEVSHEIQQAFYGHAISQAYDLPGQKVVDEQRFAYPVYVVFLLYPTLHARFDDVEKVVTAVLAILT